MRGGPLAIGLGLLIVSTTGAVLVGRHLDRPDNPRSAPGAAMMLLIINLIQILAIAITLIAIFDDPV